jgi:DNA transposition AAA+ family ATPase
MRDRFVKTENATRFLAGLDELGRRGAEEACLMVVDGVPGLGKTEVIEWCATQQGWLFIRCKKNWRPAWMLRDLLAALRVQPAHTFERMYAQTLEALSARARAAERDGEIFAVVLDEVDHIARSEQMLETVRDLSDMLEIPFILVGMGRVRHALTRYPQIASRVGRYVEFQPASLTDVKALAAGLCEVEVADDLVAFLHRASDGLIREIKEGLNKIEAFGKRNPGPVTVKAMTGQLILNDRRTGAAILVRD